MLFLSHSQILPHHTADGFGCLDLHEVGGVGVGAQGEAGVGVTQHAGDGADVYPALQRSGCEGVPQIVEANGFQPQRFHDLSVDGVHCIRVVHPTGHRLVTHPVADTPPALLSTFLLLRPASFPERFFEWVCPPNHVRRGELGLGLILSAER